MAPVTRERRAPDGGTELPAFRFHKAINVVRGVKVFLNMEAGATRGAVPDGADRSRELEAARRRILHQRRELASKEREITALKMRLSTGERGEKSASGGLPDFLIIGAQKGGTTFLYNLLARHPYVEPASTKEVHYFDVRYEKGEEWYRSHFPKAATKDGLKIQSGEASPYYLFHPHAARRAAGTVPQAKVIALLRNPVDRAYSDYQHKFREGREDLDFEAAIEAEESRLAGEKEKMLADEGYDSLAYRKYSYLARGVYVDQLAGWHEHFGRDRVLVLKSEDLFERPPEVFGRVREFLGLPEWEPDASLLRGGPESTHEGGYQPLSPTLRERLEAYFEPHNRRLYEYLGTDFGW